MGKYEELQDINAESGIIATIINEPSFINFSENLDSDCFADYINGSFYEAIKILVENKIDRIDTFNIVTTVGANEKLKKRVGDSLTVDFVNEIIKNSKYIARETSAEYIKLVNSVMAFAYRRKLYRELEHAQAECLKNSDVIDLQKSIFRRIEKTSTDFLVEEEIPEFGNIIDTLWEQTLSRRGENSQCGYLTRFPTLNNFVTYEKGELVVYCGYRKAGKSIILMNEAIDLAINGASVLILDSEMSDRLYNERMLCYLTQIPMRDLKAGRYDKPAEKLIRNAINIIKGLKLRHVYCAGYNLDRIYTLIKKVNPDIVIYDYLKSANSSDTSDAYHNLGKLTDFLKNQIAGECNIPVIAAAQLNRGLEIADSIKIEQYSSSIIKIKSKTFEEREMHPDGNYKLIVTANRLGDQMDESAGEWLDINFMGNMCFFEESATQHDKDVILG